MSGAMYPCAQGYCLMADTEDAAALFGGAALSKTLDLVGGVSN